MSQGTIAALEPAAHSDAAVKRNSVTVGRDGQNPRTEITVKELAA